ncbi:nicotinate-nucleotide--dimethylbenzimidazole phosphoribosyltransferase [Paenibacillaceae bacterium]|nr:nicotinate-nucleotide--dimethylbenzimidazole phosphoribosyltransferase [Paenibacillaceae bacterium]
MNEETWEQRVIRTAASIPVLDKAAMNIAIEHLNNLTKPQGSLGKLEQIAIQLSGITGQLFTAMDRRAVVVMAADHGVCEENVSAYPAEITAQMVNNIASGGAAINVLARQAGADVICVDIGVNGVVGHSAVMPRKIREGTANIVHAPAMERDEAARALVVGIELAETLTDQGYALFATGEMGIGNTTASSAVASVLCSVDPVLVVGRGTGIDVTTQRHKIAIVEQAIQLHAPDAGDPLDVLSKIGGLEIAGLAGLIIGAAAKQRPVVIDGFISSVAALAAVRIAPAAAAYLIPSHLSEERGHAKVLTALQLSPFIQMDMRLGEGTGAALCFHLIEASQRIMREMATFSSAGVTRG